MSARLRDEKIAELSGVIGRYEVKMSEVLVDEDQKTIDHLKLENAKRDAQVIHLEQELAALRSETTEKARRAKEEADDLTKFYTDEIADLRKSLAKTTMENTNNKKDLAELKTKSQNRLKLTVQRLEHTIKTLQSDLAAVRQDQAMHGAQSDSYTLATPDGTCVQAPKALFGGLDNYIMAKACSPRIRAKTSVEDASVEDEDEGCMISSDEEDDVVV